MYSVKTLHIPSIMGETSIKLPEMFTDGKEKYPSMNSFCQSKLLTRLEGEEAKFEDVTVK